MKIPLREVKRRRAEIEASPHTKADVQRLAGVSERSVYRWYRGVMASQKIAAAHAALTNGVQKQNRRPTVEASRTA